MFGQHIPPTEAHQSVGGSYPPERTVRYGRAAAYGGKEPAAWKSSVFLFSI